MVLWHNKASSLGITEQPEVVYQMLLLTQIRPNYSLSQLNAQKPGLCLDLAQLEVSLSLVDKVVLAVP